MEGRRFPAVAIVAGGVGVVLGRTLFLLATPGRSATADVGTVWGAMLLVPLAMELLLLGASIWYLTRSEDRALAATVAMTVVVGLFTLNDFVDGDPLWDRGYGPTRLVASWLVIASTIVVVVGVVWAVARRFGNVSTSAWWRRPGGIVALGMVAIVIVGGVGAALFGDEESAPAANEITDGEPPATIADAWNITRDGDDPGSYIFSMVRTFEPLDAADVESVEGRFVWPTAEIEVCDVGILTVGAGSVQVGIVSPTTEGCPGMSSTFVEHGVPDTACLVVHTTVGADEYCAPLRLD